MLQTMSGHQLFWGRSSMKTKLLGLIALIALNVAPASAAPVTILDAFNSVRHYGPSILGPETTSETFGADITPSGSPTTATATQRATIAPLNFAPSGIFPNHYVQTTPYSSSLTGAWTITATNGPDSAVPVLTNTIPFVELIPLLTNLVAPNGGLTPTLNWTLPNLAGFDINTQLVSVYSLDASNHPTLVDEYNLNVSSLGLQSDFTIPAGALLLHTNYVFDVTLGYYDPAYGLEDTSETYTQGIYDPSGTPLPAALPLFASGLGALGLLGWRRKRKASAVIAPA